MTNGEYGAELFYSAYGLAYEHEKNRVSNYIGFYPYDVAPVFYVLA